MAVWARCHKAQIWYMSQGSANKTAAIISTLSGTKKARTHPPQSAWRPAAYERNMGTAIKSIKPLEPGQMGQQ